MGDFIRGGEWLLKNVPIFFYGKIQMSINISIDGLQPTFRYQLSVSRGPHNTILGHALVEIVLNTWWTWPNSPNSKKKKRKNNLRGDLTPFMSKSFQIWDHFFPLLLHKDSEYLKSWNIGIWEMGARRRLNRMKKWKKSVKNFCCQCNFRPILSKHVQIWDHFLKSNVQTSIWNPWTKVVERSGLRFENFCA